MPRIFFSYSWNEKITGAHVCDLLIANGASVFRDELCIEPGEDFKQRIIAEIQSADYFIYLDSKAARSSTWVPFEVNQFMKRAGLENFIVCLAEEEGAWRKQNEFFTGLNTLTCFMLIARHDGFDPYGTFRRSMEGLCKKIGLEYCEEIEWPREDDFKKEIHANVNNHTESSLRHLLLRDFNTALSLEKFNAPTVTQRFRNLVNDCLNFKIDVATPAISFCLALAKEGQHDEASASASELIEKGFNKDPRIWHIRAGATFFRNAKDKVPDYRLALRDYRQVIQLIDASGNPRHHHQRWSATANSVICLLRLQQFEQADLTLRELTDEQRNSTSVSQSFVQLIEENIEYTARQGKTAQTAFLAAMQFELFSSYPTFTRGLLVLLFYSHSNDFPADKTFSQLMKKNTSIPITPDDYYYKGLLHFVLNMKDHEKYFRLSSVVKNENHSCYQRVGECYRKNSPFFQSNVSKLIDLYTIAKE